MGKEVIDCIAKESDLNFICGFSQFAGMFR